jgi:hypothetical protein
MDGHDLFFVWADRRNGDYDIYGRLYRYNDPDLIASPSRIDISQDITEPAPDPVKVLLTYAGIGEIAYRLETNREWIELSKNSGATPDSFDISINTSGTEFGINQGQVFLINAESNDTTGILPVTIDITGPVLDIQPDSLHFAALIEIGSPPEQTIQINNGGSGTLNFDIYALASWLSVDKNSGSNGEIIHIACDITNLTEGNYVASIVAVDSGSVYLADTLFVYLSIKKDMPYLAASPRSVNLAVNQGDSAYDSLQILNLASSIINWSAVNLSSWMILETGSGSDDDFLIYAIATDSLNTAIYHDSVTIEDPLAFNSPLIIPIQLTVGTLDTVDILPAQGELAGKLQTPLYLRIGNRVNSGRLHFDFDRTMINVDSLSNPIGPSSVENRIVTIDTSGGSFSIIIPETPDKTPVDPGYYHLGDIFMTANDSLTGTTVIEADASLDSFCLVLSDARLSCPALNSGNIEISVAMSADDDEYNALPNTYYLDQNYPNPFNGTTVIVFGLKRAGLVRLEIYNILGQLVDTPIFQYLPAGRHQTSWDGRDNKGREMASGIYFYRLGTGEYDAVKKLVFLK